MRATIEMMIETTLGMLPECELERRTGPGWVEYWKDGVLVHRSVTVTLTGVQAKSEQAKIGPQP